MVQILGKIFQRYVFFWTKCYLSASDVCSCVQINQGYSEGAMYMIWTKLSLGSLPSSSYVSGVQPGTHCPLEV